MEAIRAAFAEFDADGSGYLTADELTGLLTRGDNGMGVEDAQQFIECFDADGDGKFSIEEFATALGSTDSDVQDISGASEGAMALAARTADIVAEMQGGGASEVVEAGAKVVKVRALAQNDDIPVLHRIQMMYACVFNELSRNKPMITAEAYAERYATLSGEAREGMAETLEALIAGANSAGVLPERVQPTGPLDMDAYIQMYTQQFEAIPDEMFTSQMGPQVLQVTVEKAVKVIMSA